jgi:hypothetical protein
MTPGLSPSEVAAQIDAAARFFSKLGAGLLVIFAVFAAITAVVLARGGIVDARWVATALVVSGAFGPALTAAGVGLRRRREWGRRLTVAIVWAGIPTFVVLAGLFEIVSGPGAGRLGRPEPTLGWIIISVGLVLSATSLGALLLFPSRSMPRLLRFFSSAEVRREFRGEPMDERPSP